MAGVWICYGNRYSYARGCRCDACREANTIWYRNRRQEKYGPVFCQECNTEIIGRKRKYCSTCRPALVLSPWTKEPRPCAICGETFTPRQRLNKYCSSTCSNKRPRQTPEGVRAKNYLRRTAERLTDITPEYERQLRAKAKRCPICQCRLTRGRYGDSSKHLDHIIPICQGGTHTIGNVRIICQLCNLRRPKDGSDYQGPVTLWAQDLNAVPYTPPQPKPKPEPIRYTYQCKHCGTVGESKNRRREICDARACRLQRAAQHNAELKQRYEQTCTICNKTFTSRFNGQPTCSRRCGLQYTRSNHRPPSHPPRLRRAGVGQTAIW